MGAEGLWREATYMGCQAGLQARVVRREAEQCLRRNSNEPGLQTPGVQNFSVITGFSSKCGAWKGELGLEPTPELYVSHLCSIFDEVKGVLKKTGTCWVVIGDTYWSAKGSCHNPGGGPGSIETPRKASKIYPLHRGNSSGVPPI
jgi:hypothetical protein